MPHHIDFVAIQPQPCIESGGGDLGWVECVNVWMCEGGHTLESGSLEESRSLGVGFAGDLRVGLIIILLPPMGCDVMIKRF